MKPIHAKPQSGRTIEPGLALRIVSKRGRMVVFGQTGLLFANRQWGITNAVNGEFYTYLITFSSVPIVVATHDGQVTQAIRIYDKKTTGFNHDNRYIGSNDLAEGADCMFIAIGY